MRCKLPEAPSLASTGPQGEQHFPTLYRATEILMTLYTARGYQSVDGERRFEHHLSKVNAWTRAKESCERLRFVI